MATIEYATRDIYKEITEYCDKRTGEAKKLVNKKLWKHHMLTDRNKRHKETKKRWS